MSEPVRAADLVVVPEDAERALVNVVTGERLPATVENAAAVLEAAREMKDRIQNEIRAAEEFLAEESRRVGTKTLRAAGYVVEGKGGESVSYDPQALAEALAAADCPDDRISEVVVATVTYKVDGRVLRQLVAANPDYRAAAELAAVTEERPLRFSVKRGA